MSKPCEVVVTEALMSCSYSIGMSEITCTHSGHEVQGRMVCNTDDTEVGPNFKPAAFGFCFGLYGTCAPVDLEFEDPGPGVTFGDGKTVEKSTKCMCGVGGTISFITSGQKKFPPDQDPDGPLGINTFIDLVAKVEADNPDFTKEDIIDSLRRSGGYDTGRFQDFYDTSQARDISHSGDDPGNSLTEAEYDQLQSMLSHGVDSDGNETGIVYDRYGNSVAIGHVMTGITGGLHRRNHDPATGPFGEEMDSLWATTLAGDLGQSGHEVRQGNSDEHIGPGSEATFAEIRGDLDGLIIGESLDEERSGDGIHQSWISDGPASEFLRYYYDNYSGTRMRNAFEWLPDQNDEGYLQDQSLRFGTTYKFKGGLGDLFGNFHEDPKGDVKEAVREYNEWLEEEFDREEGFGKITRGNC